MAKRKNNKKTKSKNVKQIEKSQLNSLVKKNDLNRKVLVHSDSDRILRSNNKRNITISESDLQKMKVKKGKNEELESSGILSARVTRSKKVNQSESVHQEVQAFSRNKSNNSQCNKIEKSSKSSSVTCKQINFKRNDICFAKLTGHLPWPAQV